MAFALFIISGGCLLLAVHPFLTYPLSLRLIRRRRYRPLTPGANDAQTMAICVCAYNEEAVIEKKIENLLAIKRTLPAVELLVYVDAASDRTGEILKRYSDEIFVHISPARHGKTHGMNLLIAKTNASIILFSDANVMLDVDSIALLPGYFSDPKVGCVCGHLRYVNEGETVTATSGSLYWRLEEHIKQLESDTGSLMGADGSIFAIRRALHRPPPDDIIDDMFVSFSILCDGHRLVRAPDIRAWETSVTSSGEEFQRKVRIACQAFNVHRMLWPRLRTLDGLNLYKYVSHKFLRWLVIYWLALTAVFFEAAMVLCGMGLAGLLLGLSGLAFLWIGVALKFSPVLYMVDILGAFAATGLGVWRSLTGMRFQTWSPASSVRKMSGQMGGQQRV